MQMDSEARKSKLLEAEQRLLESIFPRHIIEALTDSQDGRRLQDSGTNDAVPNPEPDPSASLAAEISQMRSRGMASHASFTNKHGSSSNICLLTASSDMQHLSTHHKEVSLSAA